MKRLFLLIFMSFLLLSGCSGNASYQIVTTTLPVYEFTTEICNGTGILVDRLITQNVSCLHDYTLQVQQTKALEAAEVVVISGGGLESFLSDVIADSENIINASGVSTTQEHHDDHDHNHKTDPHMWLSVKHAKEMCNNICDGLIAHYPQHEDKFRKNLNLLLKRMDDLDKYANENLSQIRNRDIITFHDGFGYLAQEYNLNILKAIEEESGSEASAKELAEVIGLINKYHIQAIFTEKNGSASAAEIIATETGVSLYQLDMAMSGSSWFDAMYKNIDTLKEALG